MLGQKPKMGAIRRDGKRPPPIPPWAFKLLGVISEERGLEKNAVLSSALAYFATEDELERVKGMSDES